MIYYGTVKQEEIMFKLDDGTMNTVSLVKSCVTPTFVVTTTYNDEWYWEFWMDDPSVYEMAKHVVMDAVFECEDMDELMEMLDEIFDEDFMDFVVDEECDSDCENCEYGE